MGLVNATPLLSRWVLWAFWVPWKYHAFVANVSKGNIG